MDKSLLLTVLLNDVKELLFFYDKMVEFILLIFNGSVIFIYIYIIYILLDREIS